MIAVLAILLVLSIIFNCYLMSLCEGWKRVADTWKGTAKRWEDTSGRWEEMTKELLARHGYDIRKLEDD